MNRKLVVLLVAATLGLAGSCAFAQSNSQSLGDYARSVRKAKNTPAPTAPTVYENDNLPRSASISVIGDAKRDTASEKSDQKAEDATSPKPEADKGDKTAEKEKEAPQIKPGQSVEERQQAFDAWKDRLKAQQEKIDQLSHELEMLQREYRVKTAEFYADTARRTQNPTGFAKEDADYKKQIDDKQQAVNDAKAKLSEMQEEARKAGAPGSITE